MSSHIQKQVLFLCKFSEYNLDERPESVYNKDA